MQEEEKQNGSGGAKQEPPKKHKKEKGKSLMETMREIDAKEAQREAEAEERRQALLAEREKKEKEAYAKKIQQERIELMRLKQGIITESDTIREEPKQTEKLSFWKKIGNFFYHSKWWLGVTVIIGGIFVFLFVDYVTRVRPDMIVMLLTDDTEMQNHSQQLEEYLEQFTEDVNGDGKVQISFSDGDRRMSHRFGDNTRMNFAIIRSRSPGMAGGVRAQPVFESQCLS